MSRRDFKSSSIMQAATKGEGLPPVLKGASSCAGLETSASKSFRNQPRFLSSSACSIKIKELSAPSKDKDDLLTRFENLLRDYYRNGRQREHGLPTVRYCAQELFLSPNYFGDLIRQLTGDTATSIIRRNIMQRAKELLIAGSPISETAERLGFDYPQHFTRQFKNHFGITPTEFLKITRHPF